MADFSDISGIEIKTDKSQEYLFENKQENKFQDNTFIKQSYLKLHSKF